MTRKEWRIHAATAQAKVMLGAKVEAIRYLRTVTGCGIKEAYDAVEKLRALPLIKVQS